MFIGVCMYTLVTLFQWAYTKGIGWNYSPVYLFIYPYIFFQLLINYHIVRSCLLEFSLRLHQSVGVCRQARHRVSITLTHQSMHMVRASEREIESYSYLERPSPRGCLSNPSSVRFLGSWRDFNTFIQLTRTTMHLTNAPLFKPLT